MKLMYYTLFYFILFIITVCTTCTYMAVAADKIYVQMIKINASAVGAIAIFLFVSLLYIRDEINE